MCVRACVRRLAPDVNALQERAEELFRVQTKGTIEKLVSLDAFSRDEAASAVSTAASVGSQGGQTDAAVKTTSHSTQTIVTAAVEADLRRYYPEARGKAGKKKIKGGGGRSRSPASRGAQVMMRRLVKHLASCAHECSDVSQPLSCSK